MQVAPALAGPQVPVAEHVKLAEPVFPFVDDTGGTVVVDGGVESTVPAQVAAPTVQVTACAGQFEGMAEQVAPASGRAGHVPDGEQVKVAPPVWPFVETIGALTVEGPVANTLPIQVFAPTDQLRAPAGHWGALQTAPPAPFETRNCPGREQLGKQMGAPVEVLFPTQV